jgi:hypothetical protein
MLTIWTVRDDRPGWQDSNRQTNKAVFADRAKLGAVIDLLGTSYTFVEPAAAGQKRGKSWSAR